MKVEAKKLQLSSKTNMVILGMILLGSICFGTGLSLNPLRAWRTYLLYHTFFMGLGFGALFFLVIHYLSSAGWMVNVRRVPEAIASYLYVAFGLTLVILLGLKKIYPWMDVPMMEHDHQLHHKLGYFAPWFFGLRIVLFFVVTLFIGSKLIGNSVAQDKEGGVDRTTAQKKLCAIFLVTFAPLFTVFAVDLYKSLDPRWFSTMWGVYMFIGFVQSSIAMMIIVVGLLKKHGYLELVTEEHHHDLGKYLFGFSVFWAYIGVSQYLLIWYANLPEETGFYLLRQTPGWVWLSVLLPVFRFFLPFCLLLPRAAKRNPKYLRFVSGIVLVGALMDLHWIIMPTLNPEGFSVGWLDVGLLIGFLGVFALFVRRFLAQNNTMPTKDPLQHESSHHHVF
jgi:hypothetical protein